MTTPHKINGVDKALLDQIAAHRAAVLRTCHTKRRYADEHAARAVGMECMADGSGAALHLQVPALQRLAPHPPGAACILRGGLFTESRLQMTEQWKDILGFKGRYQVSDLGRVKALSFMQRWRHGLRRVRERILAQQAINSGYQIVHLHLDNVRSARTVHRLVAQAFHPGADPALDVNHIDGDKKNNAATNLEWLERGANHDHAVRLGLNTRAMRVRGYPINGGPPVEFDSQSQAALQLGGVRNASKVSACIQGKQKTAMGYRWEQI